MVRNDWTDSKDLGVFQIKSRATYYISGSQPKGHRHDYNRAFLMKVG